MSTKLKFAGQAIGLSNVIGKLASDLSDLNDVWADRGYNVGGADEIIDADVSGLNVTAVDIGGLVTIAQQFANFLNNVAVVKADYDSTVSKLRDDL